MIGTRTTDEREKSVKSPNIVRRRLINVTHQSPVMGVSTCSKMRGSGLSPPLLLFHVSPLDSEPSLSGRLKSKQIDRQTNSRENTSSLAEVINRLHYSPIACVLCDARI